MPETSVGEGAAVGRMARAPPVLRAGLSVPWERVKRRQDAGGAVLGVAGADGGERGWADGERAGETVRHAACDESESRESLVDPPRVRGAMT